jgi:hypothetical protein
VDILGETQLYPRLVSLLEVEHLESDELIVKANELSRLVAEYIAPR